MSNYYRTNIQTGPKPFFFRPSTSTYGTGDGRSYENAFNSFSALNQALVISEGGVLFICGEHREALMVLVDDLIIKSYPADSAWVNGQNTRTTGMNVNARTNVRLEGLRITHHTIQNIIVGADNGTGSYYNFVTIDCDVSNSGNQGIQHWGITGSFATHYNLKGNDCLDEAISGHQSGTINIYGGQFKNNPEGIVNVIGDIVVNVYNVWDTSGNGTDVLITGTSAVANVYSSKLRNPRAISGNTLNVFDSYLYFNPQNSSVDDVTGTLRLRRCIVDGAGTGGTAQSIFDLRTGCTFLAEYTTFINIPAAINALILRAGINMEGIVNCNFVGTGSTGRALQRTTQNYTLQNCIFRNLEAADVGSAGTIFRHCSFTNISVAVLGTQINSVNIDPLFVNPAALDFSLQSGSPMIGAGETVAGRELGIATANWGNTTTIPVITTKNQNTNWDIGAILT